MEEKEYLLTTLNVYTYNENKIKCDYSCIPISIDGKNWKSNISKDTLSNEGFKDKCVLGDVNKVKFNKKGSSCSVSLIAPGNLETEEDKSIKKIYYLFNKHFWYKFKYKKFLNKKKSLGQINF